MSRSNAPLVDGLLVLDKPVGLTSHDVVARCRRIVGQRRVGHAGTLDPGATGVLLVALGRATRLMRYVSELPKSYVGEVVLGRSTSTLDDEGETVAVFEMPSFTLDEVKTAASKFVGDIQQIPPMVSAIKIGGQRLHQLARAGVEIERPPRPVTIHRIDVTNTDESHVFQITVDCSSGTYIRSLAADIGEALGGGAHLRRLRRTAIGSFSVATATTLEALEDDWLDALQPPAAMVGHLEAVAVDEATAERISHGARLDAGAFGSMAVDSTAPGSIAAGSIAADSNTSGSWAVFGTDGRLLAVYEQLENTTALGAAVVLAAG